MGFSREYELDPPPYTEYELTLYEQAALKRIQTIVQSVLSSLEKPDSQTEMQIRHSVVYLEHLEQKLREILRNEESIGYKNVTLQHDYNKIRHLMQKLRECLSRCDPLA